jgi:uncharacterized membrane protein YhaH (DUF805 family)
VKDLTYLFSSFAGRLSRRAFWAACSTMLVAQMLLAAGLARTTGIGWRDFAHGDRRAAWVMLVVLAFFFWPSLALCVKRLHDRDLPGWWAALLHVLMFLFYADQAAQRPLIRDATTFFLAKLPTMMLFLVGAWLFVELVLLAGRPVANQFGPVPEDVDPSIKRSPLAGEAAGPHPGE